MLDLGALSRPIRRILAEWIGKVADRLLRFRNQIRFGFIELISSSVAETIEESLHRPFVQSGPRAELEGEFWQPRYLPHEPAQEHSEEPPCLKPRMPWRTGDSPGHEGWWGILSSAYHCLAQWLSGRWLEPILMSVVTLVGLLLLLN